MIDTNDIEKLAKVFSQQLPEGLSNMKGELEKNFKVVLQQQFSNFDLLTREEFGTQSAVLARTREKLNMLEKSIKELTTVKK